MKNETSPLCLVATVKLKPGLIEQFQEAASRVIQPTRNEPGNLTYLFHQSESDPTEFVFYEQWKSEAEWNTTSAIEKIRNPKKRKLR